MGFKFGEIVAIIIALAVPTAIFAVALTPGGLQAFYALTLQPGWREVIFFGGAAVAFAVLAWRVYRRIRPKQRTDKPASPPQ